MSPYRRYRLRELTVSLAEADLIDTTELLVDFRHFVRELDYYGRIHLTLANFGREDPEVGGVVEDAHEGGGHDGNEELGRDLSLVVGEACLEEFFGRVLCKHIWLNEITFSKSKIPTKYWRLFTENFGTIEEGAGPYVYLTLRATPFTMEGCQLLKRMCQRKARLTWLALEDCGLGTEEWRTVCEGIAESGGETEGVILEENDVTVGPDTLLPLLRAPSGVNLFSVRTARWAEGAFDEFVQALRTNETLFDLTLENYHDVPSLRLVEVLLTTCNCTLIDLWVVPRGDGASQARITALLERNKRIRSLFKPKCTPRFERYHLSLTSMWPRVLAECGRLPTQLYRFVRHGNLEDFAGQIEDVAATAAAAAAAAAPAVDRPRMKKQRRKLNSK